MTIPHDKSQRVKDALSSGNATSLTVSALESLLESHASTGIQAIRNGSAAPNNAVVVQTSSVRNIKAASVKSRKAQVVLLHEDVPRTLSRRETYALATETANTCLKVLTDSLKTWSKGRTTTSSTRNAATSSPLQPRAGNRTLARPSPAKTKATHGTSAREEIDATEGTSPHIVAMAECARLSFSFLRTFNPQKLGLREMPMLQLETGMLALVGKLIAFGLDTMAIKELRVIKRSLESMLASRKYSKVADASKTRNPESSEKESLASLLVLSGEFDSSPDVLSVAITYHAHILKVLSKARNAAVIETLPKFLPIEVPNSPADLIIQQAKQNGDSTKVVKQLEALSQTIFSLCPSVAVAADEAAIDPRQCPSPGTVLKLQVLALRTRRLWWNLAKHQAIVEKELLEPFLKCATAFARRQSHIADSKGTYEVLRSSFEDLGRLDSAIHGSTLFCIHNLLCTHAERAGCCEQASRWADEQVRDCSRLEANHARRVAALVQKTTLHIERPEREANDTNISTIQDHLVSDLTGSSADYDLLLAALTGFVRSLPFKQQDVESQPWARLKILAASFALRYRRSYPGKSSKQVRTIVDTALHCSISTDHLLSWVTQDAAQVYIQAGALQTVAVAARTKPLLAAWSASSSTMSLSRILRTVLLMAVRCTVDTKSAVIFDDEKLDPAERGALLEWQLQHSIELAPKTKYRSVLRGIVSELIGRLSKVYAANEYPVRRARVAIMAFKLREFHPEMIAPHLFKIWHECAVIEGDDLGHDSGLENYCKDLKASLALAKAFADGKPAAEDLEPMLLAWQQIIDGTNTQQELSENVDDPSALAQQLQSIAGYFAMLGDDEVQLAIRRLLVRIQQLHNGNSSASCSGQLNLATRYLDLGYSERAGSIFAQAQNASQQQATTDLVKLQFQLAYADYFLVIDNLDRCSASLDEARGLRSDLLPEQVPRDQRRQYELLHAHVWLTQSKYLLETGSPHDALAAAKRSVRVFNSIWSSCERATGASKPEPVIDTSEPPGSDVERLTKGVSKLQLTPNENSKSTTAPEYNKNGAAFWPVVPLISKALMHLSDMYAHHGLFNEATYYSERAINIAESVGSTILLSRIRSHRARLLTLAGCLEDAELCLAQDQMQDSAAVSLATVDWYIAKAGIRVKENSLQEALALYEEADRMVEDLTTEAYVTKVERFRVEIGEPEQRAATLSSCSIAEQNALEKPTAVNVKKAGRKSVKTTLKRARATGVKRSNAGRQPESPKKDSRSACYKLSKIKANILVSKASICVRLGQNVEATLAQFEQIRCSTSVSTQRRQVQHQHLMREAIKALEMDVTFNVLAESTLSFPALAPPDRTSFKPATLQSSLVSPAPVSTVAVVKTSTKVSKKRAGIVPPFWHLLDSARDCLLKGHTTSTQFHGTAQSHKECTLLSNTTLLLSAMPQFCVSHALHPVREGLTIDFPRIRAWQFEREALVADGVAALNTDLLTWPKSCSVESSEGIAALKFQEQYIDILPKSWTAVSLCLSEDASEMYIARYRSGQLPLILRLPFSRHKPEGMNEETFDYHKGKAELQEIIGLSNYSCHESGNLEAKGAKTNWWSQRETLDRRLHELLINIENIWFGGFKAIFSRFARQIDVLAQFRKSFDDILDRYLPSRRAAKGRNEKRVLDNRIFDLFTGLGNDYDGAVDLDEPIADLLYFVIDMLQFSGEHNAYDEIDFDSMAVDVLDALRAYHEACTDSYEETKHLILVLDRRLQAFPWESMPCLEGVSVSRVGSMLCLRECVLAMRKANCEGDCHRVSRASGSYILNPSSDLSSTQTALLPALSSLIKTENSDWTSIINEEPSEGRFSSLLSASSMLLYFGHGAGAQYIRPRTIKRLERCSDVVWLMGCSSGAVSEYGELEPCAVPFAYLLAGEEDSTKLRPECNQQGNSGKCMTVVATLWDVTDKDIDRFSLAVGEEWGLWSGSNDNKLPAKTPRKREVVATPSTPQQMPKTPKTPKVRKTPALAKTPARNRSKSRKYLASRTSLVEAVAQSRDACYLKYLNGAAPVVYGVPVYLGE